MSVNSEGIREDKINKFTDYILSGKVEPKDSEEPKESWNKECKVLDYSNSSGCSDNSKRYSTLERLKIVSDSFRLEDDSVEGYIEQVMDPNFRRKIFDNLSLDDDNVSEQSNNFKDRFTTDKSEIKDPCSESHEDFKISDDSDPQVVREYKDKNIQFTIDDVKAAAKLGIASHVNFDAMQELRNDIYNAKYALDSVVGVKDSMMDSFNDSLNKAAEIIEVERRELILTTISKVKDKLKKKDLSSTHPEDRESIYKALDSLERASILTNKNNYDPDLKDPIDCKIKESVEQAGVIYPKLKEDTRYITLVDFMLGNKVFEVETC